LERRPGDAGQQRGYRQQREDSSGQSQSHARLYTRPGRMAMRAGDSGQDAIDYLPAPLVTRSTPPWLPQAVVLVTQAPSLQFTVRAAAGPAPIRLVPASSD
jgi:hypothetical protein